MKKFIILFTISLITIAGLISCVPDDDDDLSLDPRSKFIGHWHFYEYSKTNLNQSYIVNIEKNKLDSEKFDLYNLGNPGVEDIVTSAKLINNKIVVEPQLLSNNWEIEGEGAMSNPSNTQMQWQYTITAGGNRTTYSITATKQ